ncbi:hypothetical protein BASA83_008283 [Batrachochytrium salamandrivorans]|nr:hypothetical protein BASA83_008283 [Batrachochytrium salamandrivorans]
MSSRPYGITRNSNWPNLVRNAVLCSSPAFIRSNSYAPRGRPRDSVYEQFGDAFAVDNLKLKRRKCNHCGRDSAASAQKLK